MNNPYNIELTAGNYYWVKRRSTTEQHAQRKAAPEVVRYTAHGGFQPCGAALPLIEAEIDELFGMVAVTLPPYGRVCSAGLPPHDPDRYRATDGFNDPESTNGNRAASAAAWLGYNRAANDIEALTDAVTSVMHLTHSLGEDPLRMVASAAESFMCEAGQLPADEEGAE